MCGQDMADKISRKRYIELMGLAQGLVIWLDMKKVKKSERCVLKKLAEEIFERD